MVIERGGQWDHNAYQTDTQFVVEVKPVTPSDQRSGGATSARSCRSTSERGGARGAQRDCGLHRPHVITSDS